MKHKRQLFLLITICILSVALLISCTTDSGNSSQTDSGNSSVTDSSYSFQTINTSMVSTVSQKNKVTVNSTPTLEVSFKDDDYYYYLYNFATIKNTPLEPIGANLRQYVQGGPTLTETFEKTVSSTQTISNTVKQATSSATTDTHKVAISASLNFPVIKINAAYNYTHSSTTTESYESTYSEASSYTETNKKTLTMSYGSDCRSGFYGYTLTGNLKVYAFVVRDQYSSSCNIQYFSEIINYWYSFDYFESSDLSVDTFTFSPPSSFPTPTLLYSEIDPSSKTYSAIKVTMNHYNCKDSNQYDKTESASATLGSSNDYEIGQLSINGCEKNGNYYAMGRQSEFSINYEVLKNTEKLPNVGDAQLIRLNEDTETRVKYTDINSKIGYGAYWVRITYTDGTQTHREACNFLKNKSTGDIIELLPNSVIDTSKKLKTIDIVVAYELYVGGRLGVAGIWLKAYANWRCEYTLNFV